MDRKSRSTMQNYTTIQVDKSPNKKMFTSDYSNNMRIEKKLPDLKLPGMSRASNKGSHRNDCTDVSYKEIRSSDLGIYSHPQFRAT